MTDNNKIIIVLAMHRSGSSLFTSWLNECGLHIGDRLLSGGIGNSMGHFEDLDFLNFHEGILKKNSVDYLKVDPSKLLIEQIDIKLANTLLDHKLNVNEEFGWKDPRTCVFINTLWAKTHFEKKLIYLYRPFEQIISSLFYRDQYALMFNRKHSGFYQKLKDHLKSVVEYKTIKRNKIALLTSYCKMYVNYQTEALLYLNNENNIDQFIAIDMSQFKKQSVKVFDFLTQKWYLKLKNTAINDVYNDALFNKNKKIDLNAVDRDLIGTCLSIDRNLKEFCEK